MYVGGLQAAGRRNFDALRPMVFLELFLLLSVPAFLNSAPGWLEPLANFLTYALFLIWMLSAFFGFSESQSPWIQWSAALFALVGICATGAWAILIALYGQLGPEAGEGGRAWLIALCLTGYFGLPIFSAHALLQSGSRSGPIGAYLGFLYAPIGVFFFWKFARKVWRR